MRKLFQRFDAMTDRVVEASNFVDGNGKLLPVRLKAILELIRGYITVAAVFFAASTIVKLNKTFEFAPVVLYGLFALTGFFLMVQTLYMALTALARAILLLLPPRWAVKFIRQLRSKRRWPKLVVYLTSILFAFLFWRLLSSLLAALTNLALH